jgi:hypothetical protein
MEEAEKVLTRLRRIDALEREQAHPALLLAELRELVREAEAWTRVEPGGTERAEAAIDRCRDSLERRALLETVPARHHR